MNRKAMKEIINNSLSSSDPFKSDLAKEYFLTISPADSHHLLGLEKAHFNASVNNNINPSSNHQNAQNHARNSQSPVEPPREAMLLGLLNLKPHETRIRKRHGQCNPTNQPSKATQEGNCNSHEEAPVPKHGPGNYPEPPRAGLVHPAGELQLHVVEHLHGIDLEGTHCVYYDE